MCRAGCTSLLCFGSLGVVHTQLQTEELNDFILQEVLRPLLSPDVEDSGEEVLPQFTHTHAAVHSGGLQKDIESSQHVFQNG